MKDINLYQAWTKKTAIYPESVAFDYLISGLYAEAGEVAGKYAKYLRDDTDKDILVQDLIKELGDVYWFLARIADEVDVDSSTILQQNINKLDSRLERGTLGGSGDDR